MRPNMLLHEKYRNEHTLYLVKVSTFDTQHLLKSQLGHLNNSYSRWSANILFVHQSIKIFKIKQIFKKYVLFFQENLFSLNQFVFHSKYWNIIIYCYITRWNGNIWRLQLFQFTYKWHWHCGQNLWVIFIICAYNHHFLDSGQIHRRQFFIHIYNDYALNH